MPETFDDFRETDDTERVVASCCRYWTSVFYALIQTAARVPKAQVAVYWEYVVSDDDPMQEVGYQWWLFFTPPDPEEYHRAIGTSNKGEGGGDDDGSSSKTSDVPPHHRSLDWMAYSIISYFQSRELERTEKGTDGSERETMGYAWQKIPSIQQWTVIASTLTEMEHQALGGVGTGLPPIAVTKWEFSAEMAFSMRPPNTHRSQGPGSLSRAAAAALGHSFSPKEKNTDKNADPIDNATFSPYFSSVAGMTEYSGPGGPDKKRVTWPRPEFLYRIPQDLMSVGQLYRKMIPSYQRSLAIRACQLEILLPKLIEECDAIARRGFQFDAPQSAVDESASASGKEVADDDDIRMDDAESSTSVVGGKQSDDESEAEQQLIRELDTMAKCAPSNTAKRSSLADNDEEAAPVMKLMRAMGHKDIQDCKNKRRRLAQVMGAHKMLTGGRTPLTGTEKMAYQKENATPYHSIARSMEKVRLSVFKHMGQYPSMAKKLLWVAQKAALLAFKNHSTRTPQMSSVMRTITSAIREKGILKLTPEMEEFYRRPGIAERKAARMAIERMKGSELLETDPSKKMSSLMAESLETTLGPVGHWYRKVLSYLEHVKHCNHLHFYAMIALICATDSLRFAYALHLHLLFASEKPGIGKSFLTGVVEAFMVPGTLVTPTYLTAAANTASDADGNFNRGDEIVNIDELDKEILSGGGENAKRANTFKHELSNGFTSANGMYFDPETGKRVATSDFVVRSVVYIGCTNNLKMDGPIASRWWCPVLPEEASTGTRFSSDMMNQASVDHSGVRVINQIGKRAGHLMHGSFAFIEKIEQSGIFDEISDAICGLLCMSLSKKLREMQGYSEPNIRVYHRLRLVARQMAYRRCICDIIQTNGLTKAKREEEITPSLLFERVPRMAFVTVEDFVLAAGLMPDELIDPLEIGIRKCIFIILNEQLNDPRVRNEHLYRLVRQDELDDEDRAAATALGQNTSAGNKNGKHKKFPDYNYLRFDMGTLVPNLRAKLPNVIQGMITNPTKIREKLYAFAERKVHSHSYVTQPEFVPGEEGTDGRWDIKPTPKNGVDVNDDRGKTDQPAVLFEGKSILIHIHFVKAVNDIGNRNATETGRGNLSLTGEIIRENMIEILSQDNMCDYQMPFMPFADIPKYLCTINTGPGTKKTDAAKTATNASASASAPANTPQGMVIEKVSHPDELELIHFPELKKYIPEQEALRSKDIRINCDLNTYALRKRHEEIMFQRDAFIEKDFDDNLVRPQGNSYHFAGVPLEQVCLDTYERFVEEKKAELTKALLASAPITCKDIDFDRDAFKRKSDGKAHWDAIAKEPYFQKNAHKFGLANGWGKGEELLLNYRELCYHPRVRAHFYAFLEEE